MALAPSLDLRGEGSKQEPPYSLQAEQALLGGLLYDVDAFWTLPPGLTRAHFFEPFHGRLFDEITSAVREGRFVDVVTFAEEFRSVPAFRDLGGLKYLVDLVDNAPPSSSTRGFGDAIVELHGRRTLMEIGKRLIAEASEISASEGGSAALIAGLESDLLSLAQSNRKLELTDAADAAAEVLRWVDDKDGPAGVLTGLPNLDLQLGPLLPGDLILVGGRPSMGKSMLACSIGLRIASPSFWAQHEHEEVFGAAHLSQRTPEPMGVIELNGEMSVPQMARRHMADIGFTLYGEKFPSYKAMRNRAVSYEQRLMMDEAAEIFRSMPIKLLKKTGLKLSELRSIVRRQAAVWLRQGIKVGLVIGDHAGLFQTEGRFTSLYDQQTQLAIGSKELADELECAFMVLKQLSREVEKRDNKRPQLSDLRDSGAWEENADAVLFPYRDAYYARQEKAPDDKDVVAYDAWDKRRKSKVIEVNVAKLREGEASATVELWGGLAWNAVRPVEPPFGDLIS